MITYFKEYQENLLYSLTLVGSSFTYLYGGVHLYNGDYFIGICEVALSTVAVINVFLYKYHKNFDLAADVILVLMFAVLNLLIITGGLERTGIFWIYTFPLLTFFLKSIKKALIWNGILISSFLFLIFLQKTGFLKIAYNFVEMRQALSAYLAVFLISFFYSYILKNLNKKLWKASIYDPLTDLYNRKYIYQNLELEIERIKRGLREKICIVYIDIDNFKVVNDLEGHVTGDKVLQEIAHIVKNNFRKVDLLGRVGGDEFLLIVENCNVEKIRKRLGKIKTEIENKFTKYKLSLSYGIVKLPEETIDIEKALKMADERMYAMKKKNKGLKIVKTEKL
ncbi:GGDEF domain-containing protein [Persephonella sp.]|uniref:GGDEF domain-containing protein n=1 Tax=Persephonella sp. TaxID=2060922 RepID=UPI0026278D01|nr:GGDEF domain-containing protein [Persephonella sp.]